MLQPCGIPKNYQVAAIVLTVAPTQNTHKITQLKRIPNRKVGNGNFALIEFDLKNLH